MSSSFADPSGLTTATGAVGYVSSALSVLPRSVYRDCVGPGGCVCALYGGMVVLALVPAVVMILTGWTLLQMGGLAARLVVDRSCLRACVLASCLCGACVSL